MEKDIQVVLPRENTKSMKARVVILISDEADFRTRVIIRDKEGYYVMIAESIIQDDIIVPNR